MTSATNPAHYKAHGGVECIDAIRSALGPIGFQSFCQGSVLKYVWRYQHKGKSEDLQKAKVYIDWLLESAND